MSREASLSQFDQQDKAGQEQTRSKLLESELSRLSSQVQSLSLSLTERDRKKAGIEAAHAAETAKLLSSISHLQTEMERERERTEAAERETMKVKEALSISHQRIAELSLSLEKAKSNEAVVSEARETAQKVTQV